MVAVAILEISIISQELQGMRVIKIGMDKNFTTAEDHVMWLNTRINHKMNPAVLKFKSEL